MKVTLVGVNASWTHSTLALYILRTALSNTAHKVTIVELALKQPVTEAIESIWRTQPQVVCLSVYIWNAVYVQQLARALKVLLPEVTIVIGGPEASSREDALTAFGADYLVKGYGEEGIFRLAESGFQYPQRVVEGLAVPLQELPFPYKEEDKAALKGKLVYYESSRGCICGCIYCLSSREEVIDMLPVKRVKEDIRTLLSYKPKVIKLVDRCFNIDRERARDIWQYVIDLDTEMPFHFEIMAGWLQAEDIELLATAPAGRIQFEAGIQSIHTQTLQRIRRVSHWQEIKPLLIALGTTEVSVHSDLIAGLPGESTEMVEQGVDAVLATFPQELQLGFLKVLPATDMVKLAEELKYRILPFPPYQVLSSDAVSYEQMLYLERLAGIINLYWNKGDFVTFWAEAMQRFAPVQTLRALVQQHTEQGIGFGAVDKLVRFEQLYGYVQSVRNEEQRSFLRDCLVWDWCLAASEAWFPPFMQADAMLRYKKEHYQDIHNWLNETYFEQEDWNTKRFIVFFASSDSFCKQYLDGFTKAVFVGRKSLPNAVVIYYKDM